MQKTGLARWERVIGEERISAGVLAEMRAQPGFAAAARHSARGALTLFARDPVMGRALNDLGRRVLGIIALYLDAEDGLTLSRLQALCIEMGLTSANRAVEILAQLRRIGYVALAAEQPNRVVRLYKPTPRMREAFAAHFRVDLEALALMEPEAQFVAAHFDEPAIAQPFMLRFGQGLVHAVQVHDRSVRGLELFSQRNCGLSILRDLLLAGEAGDQFPPKGPIRFSVAGLAKRFGVSRSHVLRLLRDAEEAGFLRRDADEGRGLLLEPLREFVQAYYATLFIGVAICAHAALQAQRTPSPRPAAAAQRSLARPLE